MIQECSWRDYSRHDVMACAYARKTIRITYIYLQQVKATTKRLTVSHPRTYLENVVQTGCKNEGTWYRSRGTKSRLLDGFALPAPMKIIHKYQIPNRNPSSLPHNLLGMVVRNACLIVLLSFAHIGVGSLNTSPILPKVMSPKRVTGLNLVMSTIPRSLSTSIRTWMYLTWASINVALHFPVSGWVMSIAWKS